MTTALKPLTQLIFFFILTGLRLMTLSFLTGFQRKKTGHTLAPEDGGGSESSSFGAGSGGMDNADRAMRAHYNAIENDLVWSMAAFALYLSGANANAQISFNSIYTAARIGHAVAYMLGKQPWRSLCFITGVVMCLIMFAYAFGQQIHNINQMP